MKPNIPTKMHVHMFAQSFTQSDTLTLLFIYLFCYIVLNQANILRYSIYNRSTAMDEIYLKIWSIGGTKTSYFLTDR